MDDWMHSVAGLDPDCLVWLLFFTDHPNRVTFNKSSDFGSERGAVERYATHLGLDAFDSYAGYKKLLRAKVQVGDLLGPAIMDDKSDDAIKFTRKVGKKLFSILRSNPDFRRLLMDALGTDAQGDNEWFPFDVPEAAPVQMAGREPARQEDGSTRLTVTATFNCAKCNHEVVHDYLATWPRDQWLTADVACDTCGHVNTHFRMGPESAPW